MTALSPGPFSPLPDDPLLTRGSGSTPNYHGPVTSAPKATTPAGVPQPGSGDPAAGAPLQRSCHVR
jgi:hypothetical protein